jgi:hypothetical protein
MVMRARRGRKNVCDELFGWTTVVELSGRPIALAEQVSP